MIRAVVWCAILCCAFADNATDFDPVFTYVDTNETVTECKDCLSKCCPGTQIFLQNICVENTYGKKLQDMEVDIYDEDISKTAYTLKKFNLVFSDVFNSSRAGFYDPDPNEKLYLLENGKLLSRRPNYLDQWGEYTYKTVCVEIRVSGGGAEELVYKQIFGDSPVDAVVKAKDTVAAAAMLVSCFFLLLVLAAYAVLPQKRNLPSLMLMAHVSCLATAFLFIAVQVFTENKLTKLQCISIGLTVYYTLLASFTWLNVMSYDLWSTTCNVQSPRWQPRRRILAKFCWYSLYGFGAPLLTTLFMVLIDYADLTAVPNFVKPHFVFGPEFTCAFESDNERKLYVNGPILVATLINIFFFVLTGIYIWRVSTKPGGSGDSRNTKKDQSRFMIYVKLFLVMGVNWILDEISAVYKTDSRVWYVTDVFNALVGLFIFIIFVCKKDMISLLCERLSINTRYARQSEFTVDTSVSVSKRQLSDNVSGTTNIIPAGFSEKPTGLY